MAKSSKIEDYWRENNIENLLKDLTHTLAQRMPSDPAAAIVQYLQKKFPKSFKTSTEDNINMGPVSKTTTSSLQLRSITLPRSDVNNESISAGDIQRRTSNVSQVSGIVTIPTTGSAFTDLFKQDTNRSTEAPGLNIRNLVVTNRLSQQAVKLGKNIRNDRDILEEELIKPSEIKANIPSIKSNTSVISGPDDQQPSQTREEPSAKRLVKYKQHIHIEKDRRLHRERLAGLAKQARDKEHTLQPDLSKPSDIQQQQTSNENASSDVIPETSSSKSIQKPIVRSKEEEEILNDENVFQPRRDRHRDRHKDKLSTLRANSPYGRKQYVGDLSTSMRKGYENSIPTMRFGICKVCGNIMNNEDNQLMRSSQQVSAIPTRSTFENQPSTRSIESSGDIVDDWFESASVVSGSRDVLPWKPDDITPRPTSTNPFFQPIKDDNIIQGRSPIPPLIITNNETKTKPSATPRLSESDVFVRTPEPKSRRSFSSRSIPSPVTKKHQPDKLAVTDPQSPKPMAQLSPSQSFPTNERRMSGWNVREYSPDDSDEN